MSQCSTLWPVNGFLIFFDGAGIKTGAQRHQIEDTVCDASCPLGVCLEITMCPLADLFSSSLEGPTSKCVWLCLTLFFSSVCPIHWRHLLPISPAAGDGDVISDSV